MSLPTPSLFHSCNIFRSISCFCFIPPFSRLSLPLSWIVFWLLSFFSHSICIWHCAATVIVATFIIELFCCKVRLYAGFLQYWPSTSFLFIWRSTTASSFLHFPLSSRLSSRKTNAGLIHLSRFNIRSIVLSLPLSHYLSLSLTHIISLSLTHIISLSLFLSQNGLAGENKEMISFRFSTTKIDTRERMDGWMRILIGLSVHFRWSPFTDAIVVVVVVAVVSPRASVQAAALFFAAVQCD